MFRDHKIGRLVLAQVVDQEPGTEPGIVIRQHHRHRAGLAFPGIPGGTIDIDIALPGIAKTFGRQIR